MNPLEEDPSFSRRGFLAAGAGAVAVAGTSNGALAQEDEENGDDENGDDENGDDEPGPTQTVEVGDNFFEPDSISIEPGTTVEWEWIGNIDHNVNPTDQPDDADWDGHPELQSSGTYEHTFDVEGEYAYTCDPHPGMDGTITVDPDAAAGQAGPIDLVPDAAWTLIIASVAGMISTLSLVYVFMRYGGKSSQ